MTTTRVGRIAGVAAVLVSAVVAVGVATPPSIAAAAEARFDYSMPDRYGLDHDGDGAIDSYVPTTTCEEGGGCTNHPATSEHPVQPGSWHVDFDACASDSALHYDWEVLAHPNVAVQRPLFGGCDDFFAEFPAEGTYRVGLRVGTSPSTMGPWTWRDVVVQDWLVVSMGDSYGAGEGSPDVEIDPDTLSDVAEALAGIGDALAELADFGPCNAGTGFDFDDCVTALDDAGHEAIDYAASKIAQLDNPVCDPINHLLDGFDAVACVQLLLDLAVSVADDSIDAIGAAVQNTYDTYVERFQDAYDAAAELVDTLQTAIENFDRGATWQDRRCHRSANAGASLAALELERRDPHTSVTLVHVACTGAMILQGLIDTYAGAEVEIESTEAPEIPPQVHQVSQLIGDREIDVVQLSIGGNDVNFGPMIFSCLLRVDCTQPNDIDDSLTTEQQATAAKIQFCPGYAAVSFAYRSIYEDRCERLFDALAVDRLLGYDAQTLFDLGRNGDPEDPLRPGATIAYDLLDQALHRTPFTGPGSPDEPDEPGLGLPADRDDRVYITEYVNPLLHESGRVCSFNVDGIDMIPGVTTDESTWLDAEIVPALTEVVRGGATQESWNFITGIVDGFEDRYGNGHGYCADPDATLPTQFGPPANARFMVRIQDAILRQANHMGGVHPSRSGYRQYAEQILPAWLGDLYTDPSTLTGPRRPDQAPFADAGADRELLEGQSVELSSASYDGDGDGPLTFSWSASSSAFTVAPAGSATPTLTGVDDGMGVVTLSVDDGDEGPSTDEAAVQVRNVAPTVSSSSAAAVEGSPLTGSVTYTDPGTADTHTATVDYGAGAGPPTPVSGGTVPLSHTYPDEGSFSVGVSVTDDDGGVGTGAVAVTVANAPPVVGSVTAPIAPVLIGTAIAVSAPFTDAGVLDSHTASVDWGDATTSAATVTEASGAGSVAASHTYTATGIYTVTVTVADGDGGVGSSQFLYVVVYDPSGGFATGGGTIDSPLGAYRPDPDVSGPAIFAFVSKYQRGATTPQGSTSFRFNAADFVFASTSYQWLVVSGARATYKGWGTVNGSGEYGFLLAAVDGDRDTTAGPDRLRLKVWDVATGVIVYDNQLGAGDDATPTTAIRAGAISVSGPKK